MAYSDLDQNQTISFNNLQSGVSEGFFTVKAAIPSDTKQVTKTQANTYININAALPSFVSKSPDQLITKQDLSGITTVSPYLMYGIANNIYKSIDGGATWTVFQQLPVSSQWCGVAGDRTGTYIAAVSRDFNNVVYISNNGGNTFYSVVLNAANPFRATDVSMSNNGQYIAVTGYSSGPDSLGVARISTSSNFGSSFDSGSYTDISALDIYNNLSIAVSGNGQYMTAIVAYNVTFGGFPNPNNDRPWSYKILSSNYGSTWTKTGGSEFFEFRDVALSFSGEHQIITSDYLKPGLFGDIGIAALVTNNYGANWTVRYANTTNYMLGGRYHFDFTSATISDDGKTMAGSATNRQAAEELPPILIRSSNYGVNFAQKNGFYFNSGISLSNEITGGIVDGYISMVYYNIGQFNYSKDGGNSFTTKSSESYPWKRLYRKSFVYNPNGYPAYGVFLNTQCVGNDLYAVRADGDGGSYLAEVMQYNSDACYFDGGGGGGV